MADAENNVNIEVSEVGANSKVYEVGYLLIPTIKEEDVSVIYGNLKELIASLGGEVIMDEMPKMMGIAYPISKVIANVRNKFTTAYFGWTKFTMDADKVGELKNKLDLDTNFLRFLTIKTVRENTIAAKRFGRGEMYKRPVAKRSPENEAPAAPINKEEIDKEIDALVEA